LSIKENGRNGSDFDNENESQKPVLSLALSIVEGVVEVSKFKHH